MYYKLLDNLKENFWVFITFASTVALLANYLGSISSSYLGIFVGLQIGILLAILIFFNPVYSIIFNCVCSYFLSFFFYTVLKIGSVPIGLIFEVVNFLGLFVMLFKRKLLGVNTLIGKMFLFWLLICCIELFNPFAASRIAWFHAIRQLFFTLIPFFVTYSLLVHYKKSLKMILYTWIAFSTLAALYTLYQEFFGIPQWHYNAFANNENYMSLVVTFGRMRKMSFLAGPMDNSMVLTFNAVVCLGLAFEKGLKIKTQLFWLLLSFLSVWATMYTGTRTATILFVFGAGLYVILSRRKELLVFVAAFVFLIIVYAGATGGGGAAFFVMKTAFNPDEDPSMIVRYNNQQALRGYLFRSPIGYGIGSTGFIGAKFSPHTFLGSFPPDSELVRIVIETGLLGLGIYLFFWYMYINIGINSLKHDTGSFSNNLKMIIVAVLFMFLLGQYPQEVMNISALKILLACFLSYLSLTKEQMKSLL